MSGLDTAGTPLSAKYNGISYRVKGDADITEMLRNYQSEMIPTSGTGMHKKTKVVQALSGMSFTVNQSERATLDTDADNGPYLFEYKDAAGVIITGQAIIAGDSSKTSSENTYSCDVQFDSKPTIIYP